MNDMYEYRMAVAGLLAATIREVDAREQLSAACAEEGDGEFQSQFAQQKRLAVYAADQDRDEAAEQFVRWWRRVGGDPLNIPASEVTA